MTTNHPAHGPVSLDRLHQIREILSKASAQSDGGNLGYAMADAVKVIDGVLESIASEQVRCEHAAWSQATFGGVGPVGPLKHLSKELAKLFRKITNSEIDAEGNAHVILSPADSLLINNARIALASLEAEAVAYMHHSGQVVTREECCDDKIFAICCKVETPLYAAPQLPQPAVLSVPAAMEMDDDFDSAFEHGKAVGWNAYRAAMLQAEPASNSDELPLDYLQGHKDGLEWAAQLAEANHPQTGNWLYDDPIELARAIRKGPDMPTVQDGNSPVIPDGWQLVPKEPTEAMNKAGWAAMNEHDAINPTYRAMLAAAPQQDVRLALEIGMSRYAGAMQKLVDSGD